MTKKHYSTTSKQLEILKLLYKFRFATSDLLTQVLNVKRTNAVNQRLKLLMEQQLIGRRHEPEYRLLRKHASYYLLSKGIEALKKIPDNKYDASVMRSIRRDKTASDQFIDYNLGVFSIYCQLKARYGDRLKFFTRSQLVNRYEYFDEFVPNVYIRISINGTETDYFLEYLQSSKPFFTVIQRLKEYIEYADSGEWEAETESTFPQILLISERASLLNRLMKNAGAILQEADDDLEVYGVIYSDFRGGDEVLRSLTDDEKVLTLTNEKPGTA